MQNVVSRFPFRGNAYKISVTGLALWVIWHDRQSAAWLTAFAPPIRLRRTAPYAGGRIGFTMLSCRDIVPLLSIHSPTTK